MTTDVVSVDKRTSGTTIARLMNENHINAVPVVTGGHRVAGVVSEVDLLKTQQAGGRRWLLFGRRVPSFQAYTAAHLMTSPAVTIHPDAPLGAAARRMTDQNLTLLPVVDSADELIGVISRRDLLRVYLRSDEEIAAEVRHVLGEILLLDLAAVNVAAHDGLVTLTGEVDRPELGPLAVRLAGSVDGVLAVQDRLTVAAAASTSQGE